ncbi:MAG: hypothetical protein ACW98K_06025 [Candidatus Kariarchaeaceae archaeon]
MELLSNPELLLRLTVLNEYKENAVQATIKDLEEMLEVVPGTWWNAYSQKYGVKIRPFPYPARNGFFIDVEHRLALYRFESKGIMRRDELFDEESYTKIVAPVYRSTWFDVKDATRCYAVLISKIETLATPIPVENFGLYNSWGKVSVADKFHHPRLIKATWDWMKKKYE